MLARTFRALARKPGTWAVALFFAGHVLNVMIAWALQWDPDPLHATDGKNTVLLVG